METKPPHPGEITFLEEDREVSRRPIAEVPESLRYARTPEGWAPVVKVVAQVRGAGRFIREYGADGTLLRETVQRK